MRINILTQPLYLNYGGILQNYALQETLRRMGQEPLTLNVPAKGPITKIWWKDIIRTGLNFIGRQKGIYPYPFLSPYKLAVKSHEYAKQLNKFTDKYISKVDVSAPFTSSTAEEYPAEAWIVGSDQVWRPCYSHYIENCFFDFLPENGAKRIAYAASFGTDKWEMSEETTSIVRHLAQKFDAVSVREESGVVLAKKNLGVEATHVLDPTLLLTAEDYLRLIPDNLLEKQGKKLTTYILDPNKEKINTINKIVKERGYKEKRTGLLHKDRIDTVEEWLADFATADAVITDSFHGTVFSLIFNKPFIVIANNARGNSRLESLLRLLEIEDSKDGFNITNDAYFDLINHYRKQSLKWLSDSLK